MIIKHRGRYIELFETDNEEYFCDVRNGFGQTEFTTADWPTPEDAVAAAQIEIGERLAKSEENSQA